MGIQNINVPIDSHDVAITRFAARLGLKYFTKLTKLLGPSLGAVLSKVDTSGGKLAVGKPIKVPMDALQEGITALVMQLDEDSTVDFVLELLAMTTIDRQNAATEFDVIFTNNYSLLGKVLLEVIKLNFASFFGSAGIGGLATKLASHTSKPSPTDSETK